MWHGDKSRPNGRDLRPPMDSALRSAASKIGFCLHSGGRPSPEVGREVGSSHRMCTSADILYKIFT